MELTSNEIIQARSEDIKIRFDLIKTQQPGIRARDAAAKLEISEGELLASRVGDDALCLLDEPEKILKAVYPLGEVMALTRNEYAVHERKGEYDNISFFDTGMGRTGLIVNPDIDLRLFMNHWKFCFAVTEQMRDSQRKSLQFFDKSGEAVHKIFLTDNSDEAAYDDLVTKFRNPSQSTFIETESYQAKKSEQADSEIDWQEFRRAWEGLLDTHDFLPMLNKFKVGRTQGLRKIGADFAYPVATRSLRDILQCARDTECQIMVFVGSRGCIQIHTGPVQKLLEYEQWYNVMDPLFNLHVQEDKITSAWVVKKPTADGVVTSLELFNESGGIIATFFGARKPGIPELFLWREIVDTLDPLEATNVA